MTQATNSTFVNRFIGNEGFIAINKSQLNHILKINQSNPSPLLTAAYEKIDASKREAFEKSLKADTNDLNTIFPLNHIWKLDAIALLDRDMYKQMVKNILNLSTPQKSEIFKSPSRDIELKIELYQRIIDQILNDSEKLRLFLEEFSKQKILKIELPNLANAKKARSKELIFHFNSNELIRDLRQLVGIRQSGKRIPRTNEILSFGDDGFWDGALFINLYLKAIDSKTLKEPQLLFPAILYLNQLISHFPDKLSELSEQNELLETMPKLLPLNVLHSLNQYYLAVYGLNFESIQKKRSQKSLRFILDVCQGNISNKPPEWKAIMPAAIGTLSNSLNVLSLGRLILIHCQEKKWMAAEFPQLQARIVHSLIFLIKNIKINKHLDFIDDLNKIISKNENAPAHLLSLIGYYIDNIIANEPKQMERLGRLMICLPFLDTLSVWDGIQRNVYFKWLDQLCKVQIDFKDPSNFELLKALVKKCTLLGKINKVFIILPKSEQERITLEKFAGFVKTLVNQ